MSNETETFWAGSFGHEYLQRNRVEWEKRIPFYKTVHDLTKFKSVLEVGCNAGWNLRAIGKVDAGIELEGCDVNETALIEAEEALPQADLYQVPAREILEFYGEWSRDLVMTAGLLIHIPEEEIMPLMQDIVTVADEFVLAIEYDNPSSEEIDYRGHTGRLWRRPYGQMYQALGLTQILTQPLGPAEGFGPNCTAWLLRNGGQ